MSVLAAEGFEAAGIACGIKGGGALDLALVATSDRRAVAAAGTFTRNRVTAAPVVISRKHLRDRRAAAVVLNAGNANAATGPQGRIHARTTCELVANELGCARDEVLVASTGLIGYPLPMDHIEAGVPKVAAALDGTVEAARSAADAILTTDTVRKEAVATFEARGTTFTVGGMAKGAAMLAPSMATMLAVITTDAALNEQALAAALDVAVADSFNTILVDGSTSTNDSVFVLASGAKDERPLLAGSPEFTEFRRALETVCTSLAEQMALDAEGATKLARLTVRGARSNDQAALAARAVAASQLVQCSLNGADPYWGRILSELGASGAYLDMEQVDIAYGDIVVCRRGVAAEHDTEALAAFMVQREIPITCDLHSGSGRASITFTDLSHAYIDENRTTS